MRFERADFLFLLVWIASAFLLLKGLGHTLYWQDEAQTGLLAERVLRYGYPRVWDGRNLITGMNGLDFNGAYALTWDSWLPYYIAAAAFRVLGPSPLAGRLPFALIAVFTLPLFYRFLVRLTADKTVALWSVVFLATSMTFLLHSRQCRYYALLPFATLLLYHGLLSLPRWSGRWTVTAALILLFYSNLLAFALALVSMGLLPLFFKVDREKLKAMLFPLAFAFAATFPMFLYSRVWEKNSGFQLSFDPKIYGIQALCGLSFWNKYYLPVLLFATALVLRNRFFDREGKKLLLYTATCVAASCLLIPIKFYATTRYFLFLLPAASLVLALFHVGAWRRSKAAGAALTLIFLGTHAWDYLPTKGIVEAARYVSYRISEKAWLDFWDGYAKFRETDDEEGPSVLGPPFDKLYMPTFRERFWRTDYVSLFQEMFHPFHDGLAEIDDFLKAHERPGERVYLPVGQYPLLFHDPDTLLAYTMSAPPDFPVNEPLDSSQWDMDRIDWFVPRSYTQPRGPTLKESEFLAYIRIKGWSAQKYVMTTPQILWEGNWPAYYRLYRIKHGEFPVLSMESTVLYHVVKTPSGNPLGISP